MRTALRYVAATFAALAIITTPVLLGARPASAVVFYSVSGHVVDSVTNANLAGVCVILRPLDACRDGDLKTDANGNWGPAALASGSQRDVYYVLTRYLIGHDVVAASRETNIVLETRLVLDPAAPPPPTTACDTPGLPTQSVYLPNITKTLGGPSGWDTPFILQNVGTVNTIIEVSYYKFADGALVTCRKVGGVRPGTSFADIPNNDAYLPDDTQFAVVVRSFGAPLVAVVNEVQGAGAGFESLAYDGASAGATKVYLPNVTRRFFGYDVPFIVQNLGTQLTTATASFISFDGTKIFAKAFTIQPGRSGVVDPDFTPGLVDGTQYAVTVTADQPISVVVNAHNETNGPPVAYSHNGLVLGGTTIYAPYVEKRSPTPSAAGYPGGVLSASGPTDPRYTRYGGRVTDSATGAGIVGVCVYAGPPAGCPTPNLSTDALGNWAFDFPSGLSWTFNFEHPNYVAHLNATGTTIDVSMVKNYPPADRVSPVVIQNVSGLAVDATLTLTPLSTGGTPQVFTFSGIAPGASRAFDPRFTIGTSTVCTAASATCLGNGEYALKITATGSVAAVVLMVTATTAGAYAAAPVVTTRQYLPNVTRTLGGSSGYTTPIYLQSAGASAATLRWYRFADATLVLTQGVTMPANSAIAIDPRTVVGLSDDTQYAVVVDGTDGAVNAIVYEQKFTGGDGVMIYEGFAQ